MARLVQHACEKAVTIRFLRGRPAMNQTVFTIEELEERIAPSTLAFAAQDPSGASSSAVPIGTEPGPWHPLWPIDPWPPGQWPAS